MSRSNRMREARRSNTQAAAYTRRSIVMLTLLVATLSSVWSPGVQRSARAQTAAEVITYGNPPAEVTEDGAVKLYVGARGLDGLPVDLLEKKEAVKVQENGAAVTVFTVTPDVSSSAVVVVLDTSGSMLEQDSTGESRLVRARRAAANFVRSLKEPVQVALVTFNDAPETRMAFSDRDAVSNYLDDIQGNPIPTGGTGTCINDGTESAVLLAGANSTARAKAVVVLTDGREERRQSSDPNSPMTPGCSVAPIERVVSRAQENHVQVYMLGFGGAQLDPSALLNLSTPTGGQYRRSELTGDLNAVYDVIARNLTSRYVLQYNTQANNDTAQVVVGVDLGEGQTPSETIPILVPTLKPDLTDIIPSQVISNTNDNIQGVLNLVPVIGHPNRVGKVEYYLAGQNILLGTGAPPTWELKNWDSATIARDQPAAIQVEARAYDTTGTGTPSVITRSLTVVKPPATIEPTLYVLFAIGVVAIITLLLTLFNFLNRSRGCMVCAVRKPSSVTKGEPLAQLIVVEGPGLNKPQEHFLYGDRSVGLGRDEDLPIQLPGERVSRQHGDIIYRRNQFLYSETKATNGTEIDGQKVTKDNPVPLRDGAEFLFGGQTRAIFRLRQAGAVAAQTGYQPVPAGSQPPRAASAVAASELHTTDWVRETPIHRDGNN